MQGVSIQHQGSVYRSLSNLGLLCQTFDFDNPDRVDTTLLRPREPAQLDDNDDHIILNYGGGMLVKGHSNKQVLNMYMQYLTNGIAKEYGNGSWRVKAIEGLGAVFVQRPKYMLKPGTYAGDDNDDDDASIRGFDLDASDNPPARYTPGPRDVIESTLNSSNGVVRRTILQTLCSIVQEEEKRITEAHKMAVENADATNYAEQVHGDQDGDASIASAVIQVHQTKFRSMLLDNDKEVRSMCVTLISTLLRQGMMNPLPFIVPLEVLTSDRNNDIASMAYRAILKIEEKSSIHVRSKFIDAICASFYFQDRVYGSANAISEENIIDEGEQSSGKLGFSGYLSMFSRLYKKLIQRTDSKCKAICINPLIDILTIYKTDGNALKTRIRFFDRMIDIFKPKVHGASIRMENKTDMLPPSQLHTVNFSGSSNVPTHQMLLFLGQTLASLPYKYEEEPLYLIYLIDRHITIHGTNSVDLGNILISTKSKECEYNENHANATYNGMYGLIILYELRKHLKKIYGLSASRIKNLITVSRHAHTLIV